MYFFDFSPLGKKRDIMNIPIAWPSICPVSIEKEVEMLSTDIFQDVDDIKRMNSPGKQCTLHSFNHKLNNCFYFILCVCFKCIIVCT